MKERTYFSAPVFQTCVEKCRCHGKVWSCWDAAGAFFYFIFNILFNIYMQPFSYDRPTILLTSLHGAFAGACGCVRYSVRFGERAEMAFCKLWS